MICSNPDLAECNLDDFEFIDMCGKQASTPNCTHSFVFNACVVKQLAGSGSVYVHLMNEIHHSVTVTDNSSEEDDLPSFGIGCREQLDPKSDCSSSEGLEVSSAIQEGSPREDSIHQRRATPAHHSFEASKPSTSSGEHQFEGVSCSDCPALPYNKNVLCKAFVCTP